MHALECAGLYGVKCSAERAIIVITKGYVTLSVQAFAISMIQVTRP